MIIKKWIITITLNATLHFLLLICHHITMNIMGQVSFYVEYNLHGLVFKHVAFRK